jgi:dihydrofolate reductase
MKATSVATPGRLTFSINVTLDGCCDHRAVAVDADEELHQDVTDLMAASEGLLFGRVTYELMESYWPPVAKQGSGPKATLDFARKLDAMPKYVLSKTRQKFDWNNTFLMDGDLASVVATLKDKHPVGLLVGGTRLATSLAQLGLIDEFRFVIHPVVAGHGPRIFEGLEPAARLRLVDSKRFKSGVTVLRYHPR